MTPGQRHYFTRESIIKGRVNAIDEDEARDEARDEAAHPTLS
jgi:hypothetical protein